MQIVNMGSFKANIMDLIEHVKRGEEVLILKKDTPVARLVPVEPAGVKSGKKNGLTAVDALK